MSTSHEYRYSFLIKSRWTQLRMRKLRDKFVDRIKQTFYLYVIIFHRKSCGFCDTVENNVGQTGHSALCMWDNWCDPLPRICNNYCFPIAAMVTRTHHRVTLYVNSLCCSTLRPIAVHMHSVFCVLCTVCGNVQQCAATAVLRGNCSAVWDAV